MFNWNTYKIKTYLQTLKCIDGVFNDGPGGDVDTDNLVLYITGTDDRLFALGFGEDYGLADTSDIEIPMVQLTDGMDSRGGLNSTEINTAHVFIAVRQYFLNHGAHVVNSIDEYF